MATSDMTPTEWRDRLAALGYVRQVDIAAALKISQSAVSEYWTGNTKLPGWMDAAVRGLRKVRNGHATAGMVTPPPAPRKTAKRTNR